MKNLRARRFSNTPINGDFRASTSVAGTLYILNHETQNISSHKETASNHGVKGPHVSFVVDEAPINSLEVEIFRDVGVDENADQSTVGHHELKQV